MTAAPQSTPALPPLPEPAQVRVYLCNKCGHFGEVGPSHANCDYFAVGTGPFYTADQLRADRRQIVERCAQIAETLTAKNRQLASWSNSEPLKPCELAAALRSLLDGDPK